MLSDLRVNFYQGKSQFIVFVLTGTVIMCIEKDKYLTTAPPQRANIVVTRHTVMPWFFVFYQNFSTLEYSFSFCGHCPSCQNDQP